MSVLLLRLAGSLQSWSGYRHQVNKDSSVPTEAMPRKSGINGLLGAALGPTDHGYGHARGLAAIGERYRLHVRVDVRNPTTEDFQVLGPLTPAAALIADRIGQLGSASTKKFPNDRRSDGNFPITVSRRDFLAHSEFVVALETDEMTAQAWCRALQDPVFMPYLGRRSCAPAFPFLLGVHSDDASDVFKSLPHVQRHGQQLNESAALYGYEVLGDYGRHSEQRHRTPYVPETADRRGQLTWAKENLRR